MRSCNSAGLLERPAFAEARAGSTGAVRAVCSNGSRLVPRRSLRWRNTLPAREAKCRRLTSSANRRQAFCKNASGAGCDMIGSGSARCPPAQTFVNETGRFGVKQGALKVGRKGVGNLFIPSRIAMQTCWVRIIACHARIGFRKGGLCITCWTCGDGKGSCPLTPGRIGLSPVFRGFAPFGHVEAVRPLRSRLVTSETSTSVRKLSGMLMMPGLFKPSGASARSQP